MTNLSNAVQFFGKRIEWNSQTTAIWLIVIQAILAVIAISLVIYVILRRRLSKQAAQNVVLTVAQQPTTQNTEVVYVTEPKEEVKRELTGISLDLGVVQREFEAGDDFSCEGLVVNAEYNVAPTSESMIGYTLIDSDNYTRLEKRGKTSGVLYVIKPYMYTVGKKVVTVKYEGQTASYTISVEEHKVVEQKPEPVVEEKPQPVVVEKVVEVEKQVVVEKVIEVEKPVVVEKIVEVEKPVVVGQQPTVVVQQRDPIIIEEDSFDARLRYDKSFTARVIQSSDETKHWYTELKNELLSYKSVRGRISWKRETFKGNKEVVAKLAYRGKLLCVFLPLNPADYAESLPVEDASDMSCYEDTPLMIRLKSSKRVDIAMKLIQTVMEQRGLVLVPHESVDYYMPYEGIVELMKKGLIKRDIRTAQDEAIFERDKGENVANDEDESFELQEVAPGIYVTKKD